MEVKTYNPLDKANFYSEIFRRTVEGKEKKRFYLQVEELMQDIENQNSIESIIPYVNQKLKNLQQQYISYQLTILLIKLRVFLFSKSILNNGTYQVLLEYCSEDLEYYQEVINKIKIYLRLVQEGEKTSELNTIYLITIKLIQFQNNIKEYINYITNVEKLVPIGIDYQIGTNIIREDQNMDINEIDTMLNKLALNL